MSTIIDRELVERCARAAATALVVWDLITPEQQDTLTAPVRAALPDLWTDVSTRLPDEGGRRAES